MKYTSIYFSPTGTSEKIIKTIVNEIFEEGMDFDLTLPKSREKQISIDSESVIIVGSPVYSGRTPFIFETYLKSLNVRGQDVILVALYGNRAYEDALLEMKDIFKEKNCNIIGAGAFIGEHSITGNVASNRPDEKDIAMAKSFAEKVKENIGKNISVEVDGKRPYRVRKSPNSIGPSTNDNCNQCKLCAENCPVGAISMDDCKIVDAMACINCFRCVRECPKQAKYYDERFDKIIDGLETNCTAVRLEPEIFV
ncbi:MAG: EFR1 family ferrodoxin [Bacillota bacterium]|nr:EFR1 family ferrodoxin [Bacillota bacterium]